MNTYMKQIGVVLCGGLLAAAVAGCDKQTSSGETVGQKVDKAIDKTNQKLADAGNKMEQGVNKAEDALKDAAKTTEQKAGQVGQILDDATITAAVKAEYVKDREVDALKIDVDTKNGIVTLNGVAPSETGRNRAETLAMSVKGVSKVNNNLTIKKG